MAEQIISKTCRICKQTKLISEFCKRPASRDGFKNECRICGSKQQKEYRQTEQGKAARKRYAQGERGKVTIKCYAQSEKRRVGQKRHQQSEKFKVTRKRYIQSEKRRTAQKHYDQSKKGRAAQKRFKQSEKGKKAHVDAIKQFNIRHPERAKAHGAVNYAIKTGQLPRPDSLQCHYCPAQAKQYHHYQGYEPEHWLDVFSVCIKCHNAIRD